MRLRKSNVRIRVEVHGPKVSGAVSPEAVERYILDRGWHAMYVHDEPRCEAAWYDAKPASWWQKNWPRDDLPLTYERVGADLSLPSPYCKRVPLGELIDMLGQAEGRAPSDVLRDITGKGVTRER